MPTLNPELRHKTVWTNYTLFSITRYWFGVYLMAVKNESLVCDQWIIVAWSSSLSACNLCQISALWLRGDIRRSSKLQIYLWVMKLHLTVFGWTHYILWYDDSWAAWLKLCSFLLSDWNPLKHEPCTYCMVPFELLAKHALNTFKLLSLCLAHPMLHLLSM